MKHDWSTEELAAQWSLLPSEREFLGNKTGATRLGFAVLLKFFQAGGRFPRHAQEVPERAVEYVARQVGVLAAEWLQYLQYMILDTKRYVSVSWGSTVAQRRRDIPSDHSFFDFDEGELWTATLGLSPRLWRAH